MELCCCSRKRCDIQAVWPISTSSLVLSTITAAQLGRIIPFVLAHCIRLASNLAIVRYIAFRSQDNVSKHSTASR